MNNLIPLLHYEQITSSSPPKTESDPLILLHGLFGSAKNLMSLAKLFSKDRPVYILDLPNHGSSPWITNASYQSTAACLQRSLIHIAIDTGRKGFHIFGHSMGGKATMTLALTESGAVHSQKTVATAIENKDTVNTSANEYVLRSIIVGDIAPRIYQPSHMVYFQAMKNMPPITSRKEADTYMEPIVKNPVLRSFLLKNLSRDKNNCLFWKINLDVLIRDYPLILGWNVESEIKSLTPALFLRGTESDYIIPERDRECIWGYFPNARLVDIHQSGHWIHANQPQAVYSRISEFITSLEKKRL